MNEHAPPSLTESDVAVAPAPSSSHASLETPALTSAYRGRLELAAALATGAVKLAVDTAELAPGWAIVGALALLWLGYILTRLWRTPGLAREWGLTRENLGAASRVCAVLATLGVVAVGAVAWGLHGSLYLHWTLPLFLLAYPVWGLMQQFMLQAIVASNLARLRLLRTRPWAVVGLAALLFAVSHLPRLDLAAATFVLGLLAVPIYLRWRNLWPIAVLHGILGTSLFYWMLQQQPLARFADALG